MPASDQAGKREADLVFLAEDDSTDLNDNGIEWVGHAYGMDSWMRNRRSVNRLEKCGRQGVPGNTSLPQDISRFVAVPAGMSRIANVLTTCRSDGSPAFASIVKASPSIKASILALPDRIKPSMISSPRPRAAVIRLR